MKSKNTKNSRADFNELIDNLEKDEIEVYMGKPSIKAKGIPKNEWLLYDATKEANREVLQQQCVWEYARQSEKLRKLFDEVQDACMDGLNDGESLFGVAEFLYTFAGELVHRNFNSRAPVNLSGKEKQTDVFSCLFEMNCLLPGIDWRFLLSPYFPNPWKESQEWETLQNHRLKWQNPPNPSTTIPKSSYSAFSRGIDLRGRPGSTFLKTKNIRMWEDNWLHFNSQVFDLHDRPGNMHEYLDFRCSVVLADRMKIADMSFKECVLKLNEVLLTMFTPLNMSDDTMFRRLAGEIRIGDSHILFNKETMQTCVDYIRDVGQNNVIAFLALQDQHQTQDQIWEAAFDSMLGLKFSTGEKNIKAKILSFDIQRSKRALKDLGALRIEPRMTREIMDNLWESQSGFSPKTSIDWRVKKNEKGRGSYENERSLGTALPIYGKWPDYKKAVKRAAENFKKLFPELPEADMQR